MDTRTMAKRLGCLGGKARAKKLSREARRRIAALGGHARAESLRLEHRILVNFRYAAIVRELMGRPEKHIGARIPRNR